MAWKKVLPMEERIRFVLKVRKRVESMAECCRRFGVSRKTGYKWLQRHEAQGWDGLQDRSRRPLSCAHQTPARWVKRVLALRRCHPRWGPKKLWVLLSRRHRRAWLPAVSTLGAILRRAGLVRPRSRRRKRQRHDAGVLTRATRPNQVWTVDFKGWFRTRDGQRCDPLTVADLYSRYVLEVRAVPTPSYGPTRRVFERLFAARGLPEMIRCDNGGPFAAAGAGGLSRLSAWWWRLGIQVEWISPGHPEQNGAHERMHLTLKQDTAQPAAANRRAQQWRMNSWRRQFNEVRPHEALGQQTPGAWYQPSERRYTGTPPLPPYPAAWAVRRVHPSGEIKWQGRRRFVSEALSGLPVGLQPMEEGRQHAWFGSVWLGDLHDADTGGIRSTVGCHRAMTALTKNGNQKRRRK